MSIDAVHRSRRYEASEPTEEPVRGKPAAPTPRRDLPELEHPIAYPRELFAGSTFTKKSATFGRADNERKTNVVERSAARGIEYPTTTLAPKAKASSAPTIHTNHPNEIGAFKTKLPLADMVVLARKHWPELTEAGARTLVSQWAAETGFGRNCFSYNFGNVKCVDPKQGHMYLYGTWEIPENEQQARSLRAAGAVDADEKFRADKGVTKDMTVLVFNPPHQIIRGERPRRLWH